MSGTLTGLVDTKDPSEGVGNPDSKPLVHMDSSILKERMAYEPISGHASRSTMLFFLISHLWLSTSTLWLILLLFWNLIICYSRYAMHRHHFIDILAGYTLGYIEYWLIIQLNYE
ncbi:unnamed protein product [Schistosoma mattheei]|uniref:Uncharacterized protein n=1 Tax=Schistosoma mattheei TaxID=31246 RepID=A0A183Q5T7_9TREM|nr:unnamed protein product [Schistosoma mattheei]